MRTKRPSTTATTPRSRRPSPPADPPAEAYIGGANATEDADRLTKPSAQKLGNPMVYVSRVSAQRSSDRAPVRVPVIIAVAAFALAGCNPNQEVSPSSPGASQVFAGHYEETNPYNPISYAQNNTGRGGGR